MNSAKCKAQILIFLIGGFNFSLAQPVEITERFREVAQNLIKEQFKNVVVKELEESDPILAASTYDLIDRVLSNDSLPEIKRQIIVSVFDYIEFLHLRNYLKTFFPQDAITKTDGSVLTEDEYDKLMGVSGLLVYKYLADKDLLVTSEGLEKILVRYSDFFLEFRPLPNSPTAVTFDGSVADFMDSNKAYIDRTIRFNAALKNVVVSLSSGDSVFNNLEESYREIINQQFASRSEFLSAVHDTVKQMLLSLRDEAYLSYGKKYSDMFTALAPYVNSMIFQKIEQQPIDYSREMLIMFVSKLEDIFRQNRSRMKYKLGLWAGVFISGTAWDPPATKYPVLSFRINDRFQYTLCDSCWGEVFAYVGGFSDIFIKELSNNTSNQFGYAGLGITIRSFTFAASATIPVNRKATDVGFVLSMMYDLPIDKLIP